MPDAILKVKTDGTVTTLAHPVVVKDCDDAWQRSLAHASFTPLTCGAWPSPTTGTVYAAVTGCRCVVKVTPEGKVETVLKAERPWTPTGVAVRGKDVFVLEYTNTDKAKGWVPRVRKLGPDGKVSILATVTPDEE